MADVEIEPFNPGHLAQLTWLVNGHLAAVLPGWAVPEALMGERLRRNPAQRVLDPWVDERVTWCAVWRRRLVAAAHLLRYRRGPEVTADYQGAGDLAWLLAWPGHEQASAALLERVRRQMDAWGIRRAYAEGAGLPVPAVHGVPDAWPHVAAALAAAGYAPEPGAEHAIYGGWLQGVPAPAPAPVDGLRLRRTAGDGVVRFAALFDGREVGACDCDLDLTLEGGRQGWAELAWLEVKEGWRRRGIGAWLVANAAAWLRLGGCDRVVLLVEASSEAAGAGAFYRRLGWDVLARLARGWQRPVGRGAG